MSVFRKKYAGLFILMFCVTVFCFTGCGKEEAADDKTKASTEKEVKVAVPSSAPITEERVYYGFEENLSGWEIPLWSQGKSDYVAEEILVSDEFSSHGDKSMKITSNFPGGLWAASLVEIQQYLDLSPYRVVRADVYIPQDAPVGLKAKFILTVGENWKFVEMSRSVPLVPGEWIVLNANIEPGSYDWKRVVPDEDFARDVRKIAIRIESNRKPMYSGVLYVDNIRAGK